MNETPTPVRNRRASERRPLRLLCEAVRERDFTALGNVALDLSATGMLVRTATKTLTGEAVFVSFFDSMQGRWFDLEATVARVIHGRRPTDEERSVALEFSALRDEDRAAIERALAARAPSVPTAKKRRGQA